MGKRNEFFNSLIDSRPIKGLVYAIIGFLSYPGINLISKLKINGMNRLRKLPKQNVIFVSNHHTYFADVITMMHVFCAVSWGRKKSLGFPFYLLWPFIKVKYVAAATTMKRTFLSRIFTLAGAVTVKRTWNSESGEIRKGLDIGDTRNISRALGNNWVITFPQGTTIPFAPGRKGTAFIIKQNKPIVVPVVIKGFSDAFSKNGLKIKRWRSDLEVTFKEPLEINYENSADEILQQIMKSIEQVRD